MARIRTIKPDFWTDEDIVECSVSARLLFIGLLNFADDNGNLVYSIKKIKMQVFPGDSFDCEPLINELITHGLLIEYSVNGSKYLNIKGFVRHQVINRKSKTDIPEPDFTEPSSNAHGVLTERSLTEGKGKEGKGREGIKEKVEKENPDTSPSAPPAPQKSAGSKTTGTRLPENFQVPDDWIDWATDERPDIPPADMRTVAESFVDYWAAKAGAAARKVDWQATWRNWVRNQRHAAPPPAKEPKFDPTAYVNRNRVPSHDIIDI